MLTKNKKFLFAGIIIALCFIFAWAQDPEYKELNIFTGNLDATRSNAGLDTRYLLLDTSNDPLTGDLDLGTNKIILRDSAKGIDFTPNEIEIVWTERQIAGDVNKNWAWSVSDSDGSNLMTMVTGGRLYTSPDGGENWVERRPAGDTNKDWITGDSDSDGSNLIAAVAGGRLYTSSDGGENWTERKPAGDTDKAWGVVTFDSDGSHLMAMVTGGRLYTSPDGGENWVERRPAGDADKDWFTGCSDSDGSHLMAGVYGGRLYTSSDGGENWTERRPAGDVDKAWALTACSADGSRLMAGVLGGRLYTSSDSGANWLERRPAGDVDKNWGSGNSDADGINLIAAEFTGRIYVSNDSGVNWSEEQPAGDTDGSWTWPGFSYNGKKLIIGDFGGRLYTSENIVSLLTVNTTGTSKLFWNETTNTFGFDKGITLTNGSSINLQEDISFTGTTLENLIKFPDNLADALSLQEGTNKYITIDSTDDAEMIDMFKNVEISKADPELKGTDTGDGNSWRLKRTDSFGQMNLYNTVQKSGGPGNALRFDGVNECVTIASKPLSAIGTGDMTLVMWIKPATWNSPDTVYGTQSADAADGFSFLHSANNAIRVFSNNTNIAIASNSSITIGSWQHIAFVRTAASGAGSLKIYVNGIEKGSGDANNISFSTTHTVEEIACVRSTRFFEGDTDDVGIWDKALSVNDLIDLYNSGSGLIIDKDTNFPTDSGSMGTNLLAVWNMDESSGVNVSDSSGNGNNGTTQNMEDIDWVTGKVLLAGADNEINVISAKDGVDASQGYVIEIGESTNPGEIIIYGDEQNWNINGTTRMNLDINGTLTIDNGVTTAQQLILKAAVSASENIFETQDSSSNIGFAVEEDFDIIQGSGATGKDYTYTFNGETNDGVITWMEDEDYFLFSDDILNDVSEKHYFRDLAIGIYSQADTFLDLFADGAVRIGDSSAGAPTNYANFASDGELTLTGTARVKKHLVLSVGSAIKGASAPTSAIIGNYAVLQFSNVVTNAAYVTFHTPDDWAAGTDILIHVHWAPVNGNAGDVVWDIDYSALASDANELISVAGTNITVTDSTQSLQDELLETDEMTIVAANIADLDSIGVCISRDTGDAADTYGAAASLIYLEINYTANKLGSDL